MNRTSNRERLRALLGSYLTPSGRQAAWNLLALVILTILTQAAALVMLLLVTNHLGAANFGVLAFALSLQPYLTLAGTLGTGLLLFRDGIREPEHLDEITTVYQLVGLAGSIVVGGLTAAAAWAAPISSSEQSLLWLIAGGNVAACLALTPLFDVHHRQPLAGVIGLAAELAMLLAIWTLARTGALGLVSLGVVLAVKWWVVALCQYVLYHLCIRPIRLSLRKGRLGAMLVSSLPLAGSTAIAGLPANAGVFFVRWFRGDAQGGVFGIASQAAGAYLMFSYLAIRILQPHIAGPYGLDRRFLRKLVVFAGTFLGLLYAGGFLSAGGVILLLLRPDYREAIAPMAVMLGAAVVLSVGVLASSYLVVLHRERTVLAAQLSATVVYICASLLLVPVLGSLGAATAAALAAAWGSAWMVVVVRAHVLYLGKQATPGPVEESASERKVAIGPGHGCGDEQRR
jgi:O-antigen/teichoic acid export membrane protein